MRLCRIPFILAQNKKDTYFEGGDSACPPGPPLRNVIVLLLPSRGLSHWGEPSGGGETPMNVRVFKNISTELKMHMFLKYESSC
jgi:hypothetical protein